MQYARCAFAQVIDASAEATAQHARVDVSTRKKWRKRARKKMKHTA